MLKKQPLIFLLLTLYLLNTGCVALFAGAAAGGAGIIWVKGKLVENVSAPVPSVRRAVNAGLKDLKINVTEDRGDNLTAEVRGILADGKKVWVDAESVNSTTTKLSIRVGYLGDKTFSLRIRDAIKKHL